MVCPFLNRLVCTNGLVLNTMGQRKHHVGRQIKAVEDSFELYSDSTIELEDRAFLSKFQDVARATMDESRYPVIIDQLKESAEAKITGAVSQVVELTARNFGLRKTEQDDMLKYLIEGGDLSLYGIEDSDLTPEERHINSLSNNGARIKAPDGTTEPVSMDFYRRAVEACIKGGCNAITYELELPGIDGEFMIAIWKGGHVDSGSAERIFQVLDR